MIFTMHQLTHALRSLLLLWLAAALFPLTAQQRPVITDSSRVLLDADTGNEVDDLYALVRGLIEPDWDVVGINATQWQASHLCQDR